MMNITIHPLTRVMNFIITITEEELWGEYIMEAHGIEDHGSIVEEVEGECESRLVEVVAQVVEVVAQVVEVVAQVVEVVAQVAEVVAQVVAEEDLANFVNMLRE
jgi:hypothetical protein